MTYFGINSSRKDNRTVNASHVREDDVTRKRVLGLERDLRENTSAISLRQKRLRESLLAYTQRLQSLTKNRNNDFVNGPVRDNPHLYVQAKRIRKQNASTNTNLPRRILSLEELINRPKKDDADVLSMISNKPTITLPLISGSSPLLLSESNKDFDIATENLPNVEVDIEIPQSVSATKSEPHKDMRNARLPTIEREQTLTKTRPFQNGRRNTQYEDIPEMDYRVIMNDKLTGLQVDLSTLERNKSYKSTRKRSICSNGSRGKRVKLPLLDSIPEVDDNIRSAGKSARSYETVSHKSANLPGLVLQNISSIHQHFPRKRGRALSLYDQDDVIPYKRPHSGVMEYTVQRGMRTDSDDKNTRMDQNSNEEQDKLPTLRVKSKKKHPRLIFLRDSPVKGFRDSKK